MNINYSNIFNEIKDKGTYFVTKYLPEQKQKLYHNRKTLSFGDGIKLALIVFLTVLAIYLGINLLSHLIIFATVIIGIYFFIPPFVFSNAERKAQKAENKAKKEARKIEKKAEKTAKKANKNLKNKK